MKGRCDVIAAAFSCRAEAARAGPMPPRCKNAVLGAADGRRKHKRFAICAHIGSVACTRNVSNPETTMTMIAQHPVAPAALGHHVIAEFYGACALFDAARAEPVLRAAAEAAEATVLDVNLHDFGDRCGFTGVALLAESHISIHTWPEYGYAAIDIFMCGDVDPMLSLDVLRRYFKPAEEKLQVIKRGFSGAALPVGAA